jgi:hypothetical protein
MHVNRNKKQNILTMKKAKTKRMFIIKKAKTKMNRSEQKQKAKNFDGKESKNKNECM